MSNSTGRPYWNICRRVYLVWAIVILLEEVKPKPSSKDIH